MGTFRLFTQFDRPGRQALTGPLIRDIPMFIWEDSCVQIPEPRKQEFALEATNHIQGSIIGYGKAF